MHPYQHAQIARRRWGGTWQDYMPVHELMDSSAAAFPDVRHRVVFHHVSAIPLIQAILNRQGYQPPAGISVRDIVKYHILEDVGFLASYVDWMSAFVTGDLNKKFTYEGAAHRESIFRESIFRVDRLPLITESLSAMPISVANSFGAHLFELCYGSVLMDETGRTTLVRDEAKAIIRHWWQGTYPSLHDICIRIKLKSWMHGEIIRSKGGYKKLLQELVANLKQTEKS